MNIIIHEPPEIDTSELRKQFNTKQDSVLKKNESSQQNRPVVDYVPIHSESEYETEIETNCKCKCNKNNDEYIKVEKKRVFKQLHKFSKNLEESKKWPESTTLLCWWCCHSFDNQPIPSVITYEQKTKTYQLKGLFCSWECSAAYSLKNFKNLTYLYKLYRDWTGEKNFLINKAPSRYVLKAFGGYMSINEFRK